MRTIHCQLNIMGIVIDTIDNNHILQSATGEEAALVEESQISRPEKRSLLAIGGIGHECFLRRIRTTPITHGYIVA